MTTTDGSIIKSNPRVAISLGVAGNTCGLRGVCGVKNPLEIGRTTAEGAYVGLGSVG